MTELTSYCDIVLGNEEDAEMHFGIKPEGLTVQTQGHDVKADAFLSVCKQMMEKFPKTKKVITTPRGSISASHNTWAGVLYDGKTMYDTTQYQITDIVDRVGSGDSFMGGLIYGLIKISIQRSTCTGLCCGSILLKAYYQERCKPCDGSRSRKTHGWRRIRSCSPLNQ